MTFYRNKRAFTLMELITVVVIVSIIAAFAIPNYNRSVLKAHEKDIVANMRAIVAAEEIYRSENGVYWPTGFGGMLTPLINTNLRLGIVENQVVYTCFRFGGLGHMCQAIYQPNPQWTIRMSTFSAVPWNIVCFGGGCPTCTGAGCPN